MTMATKKGDTVQLTHSNGATVRVPKDRADALLAMGFSKPKTTGK
jgi:hypothetical protein